jgi:hypothetical protein
VGLTDGSVGGRRVSIRVPREIIGARRAPAFLFRRESIFERSGHRFA